MYSAEYSNSRVCRSKNKTSISRVRQKKVKMIAWYENAGGEEKAKYLNAEHAV